jgi:cytochrome c553
MTRGRLNRAMLLAGTLKALLWASLLWANLLWANLLWANAGSADYTLIPAPFISCTTCHGVELKGNRAMDAPAIGGMAGWTVSSQLLAFQSGRRGVHELDISGQEMQAQAAEMSADDIKAAADFVSGFVSGKARPALQPESVVEGDAGRGRSLYQSCAVCHGERGQGDERLQAPALAGQSDWYLLDQLDKFSSGARGYASGDTPGQQMRAAIESFEEESFEEESFEEDSWPTDVVAYINTLNPG